MPFHNQLVHTNNQKNFCINRTPVYTLFFILLFCRLNTIKKIKWNRMGFYAMNKFSIQKGI